MAIPLQTNDGKSRFLSKGQRSSWNSVKFTNNFMPTTILQDSRTIVVSAVLCSYITIAVQTSDGRKRKFYAYGTVYLP